MMRMRHATCDRRPSQPRHHKNQNCQTATPVKLIQEKTMNGTTSTLSNLLELHQVFPACFDSFKKSSVDPRSGALDWENDVVCEELANDAEHLFTGDGDLVELDLDLDLYLDLDLLPEFEKQQQNEPFVKNCNLFSTGIATRAAAYQEPCSKRCRTNETRFVGTAGYDLSNQKEERTSYSYEESAPTTSRMKRKHNATSSSTNCDIFTGADTPPGISNLLLSQSKPEFLEIQIQHMSTRLADSMERSASSRKLVNNEAAKLSSSAAGWKCPNSSSLLHESGMQIALFMSNISSKTF